MKNKAKPVDPSKLPSMSATLLAFAKPLLDQLPEPPTAKGLQGVLNIASVVWNLRVYDQAQHPNAAALRAELDAALASMPPEGQATLTVLSRARLRWRPTRMARRRCEPQRSCCPAPRELMGGFGNAPAGHVEQLVTSAFEQRAGYSRRHV